MKLIDDMTVREAREYKEAWGKRFDKAIDAMSKEYAEECGEYPRLALRYVDVTEICGNIKFRDEYRLSGVEII